MRTVKPNVDGLANLQIAAVNLKSANQRQAQAQKDIENAKNTIRRWLADARQIDIDTLPIGDIIQIEGVCLVERGKQYKFDEAAFAVANPDLYQTFKRNHPMNRFKPLV